MNNEEHNKNWNTRQIIDETLKSYHNEPSPETKERLVALEVNQNNIMDKLEQFQSDNKEAHNGLVAMITSIEAKLDKALEKKADKSTVNMVEGEVNRIKDNIRWVVYTVIGTVIAGIIGLVYFK